MSPVSVYIHVPFCIHRCGYCDFNTFAGLEALIPAYSSAVCREIELLASKIRERLPIHTIYFGGGTPSLLPTNELGEIFAALDKHFQLLPSLEISLEANPGTVSKEYLQQLHSLGVNRLSLGMQSSNQVELTLLERQHSFKDIIRAVEWSRSSGITNLNLDLIFGLPYQGLKSWMANVEAALFLEPEHLSLYSLTLEQGTPMHHKIQSGLLPEPDPDLAADMYEAASSRLADEGYIQYEISNWARVDENGDSYTCKHNLQYWRTLPYLGIGAGAHGFINHQRTVNISTQLMTIQKLVRQ
jgi:oxygen-independent coproporphyrinogen-3 oxidase